MPIKPEVIVDGLYDIALDPHSLESFIDVWTQAGLDNAEARLTVEAIDQFDKTHKGHLERASAFLERGEVSDRPIDLSSILQPFDSLAAFVVDDQMQVSISNEGAQHFFGLRNGTAIDQSDLPEGLRSALTRVFAGAEGTQLVIKADMEDSDGDGPVVMQLRQLSARMPDGRALALVVTTNYRWNKTLGPTLGEVFGLTTAEQGVVQLLVEGRYVKEIAELRGTSEGTVRGQLKSILSKMNARSQSEIIRLVVYLQEVSKMPTDPGNTAPAEARVVSSNWIDAEVWKPFKSVILPDGRRMDYHEMGPANGAPVLYSHMGYCMARWYAPMVKLAFRHGLRVICPIRAGYGHSDNLDPKADVLSSIREDTLFLMDHLNLSRLPYVVQGNDLVFAMDLAGKHPDRISEIIGLGARPFLHGDLQYAGMSKWHRFFLSTARHSPHLLRFTARASVSLMRRIGVEAMFKNAHKTSAPDMAMDSDQPLKDVLIANAELTASKTTDASQAYTMELILTETPWDHLIFEAAGVRTWFMCGAQDPMMDIAAIAAYRETYPWIDIEVIQNAGQMLIYQHYDMIIPRLAKAARAAQKH